MTISFQFNSEWLNENFTKQIKYSVDKEKQKKNFHEILDFN